MLHIMGLSHPNANHNLLGDSWHYVLILAKKRIQNLGMLNEGEGVACNKGSLRYVLVSGKFS